jgi:phosphopantothenoylcysteine decarboxylase / phosphopantothenate---cysteine ligase
MNGRRVLLGVTGGVAAYKSVLLTRRLMAGGAEVQVVMTESAARFVGRDTFAALTGRPVPTGLWEAQGDIVHVRLAHEADVAAVAPATANVIAKLALGLADDLLTSSLLEFGGPLVVAPAMHTGMWEHPATRANVETLAARGVRLVGPVSGALAHGDAGMGRMAEPEVIAETVEAALHGIGTGDLVGTTVVVTAGPTHEPIDAVRFIGNRSSGAMGIAVAAEAASRGARVQLILGPETAPPPAGVEVQLVETAEDMRQATMKVAGDADAVIMTAAVADFRPTSANAGKLKKSDGVPALDLEPTADILAELGAARRPGQVLVGFAAETRDVEAQGRDKLQRKQVDLIVANEVGRAGTGFGATRNTAAIVSDGDDGVALQDWTKVDLARALMDRVAARLASDGVGDPG